MDFNLIHPFANHENVMSWHNTHDIYKTYARMCTPTMWKKIKETHKGLAAWMKQWLSNENIHWCCKSCHGDIIQHGTVHYITTDHIYVNVYDFDKIYYDMTQPRLRIRCPECRALLDDSNIDSLIKIKRTSIYFNEVNHPLNYTTNTRFN